MKKNQVEHKKEVMKKMWAKHCVLTNHADEKLAREMIAKNPTHAAALELQRLYDQLDEEKKSKK